jgi:hypothetical protein
MTPMIAPPAPDTAAASAARRLLLHPIVLSWSATTAATLLAIAKGRSPVPIEMARDLVRRGLVAARLEVAP